MALVLAAAAAAFWGLSNVLVSRGSGGLSITRGTALSLGVSFIVVTLLAVLSGEPWHFTPGIVLFSGAVGVLNFPLTRYFLYRSIAGLGAPMASVLRGAAPFITLLLTLPLGLPIGGPLVAVGTALVVVSVTVLFASDLKPSLLSAGQRTGLLFGLFAMLGFGALPLFIRLGDIHATSPLWESALALLVGFLVSAGVALISDRVSPPTPVSRETLWQGLMWFGASGLATGLAQSANWVALHLDLATAVAAITAGSPVFTAAFWPLFGGKLNRRLVTSAVLVSLGAAMVAISLGSMSA